MLTLFADLRRLLAALGFMLPTVHALGVISIDRTAALRTE